MCFVNQSLVFLDILLKVIFGAFYFWGYFSEMKPCHKCLKPISDDQVEKAPRCDSCRVSFHLECSGLCASEQRAIVVQKRIILFFCEDCILSFKKIPLLTNKFVQLEEQIKSLKEEIEVIKQQNLQTVGATDISANMDSVIHEMQSRADRANNLVVYGVPESNSRSLQQKINDDNAALLPLLNDIELAQDDIVKVLRVGKVSEGKTRPIKLITKNPRLVKNAVARRKWITNNDIKISFDKTKLQQDQFRATLADLRSREEKGESDLIIKFVNGVPTISKKPPPKN